MVMSGHSEIWFADADADSVYKMVVDNLKKGVLFVHILSHLNTIPIQLATTHWHMGKQKLKTSLFNLTLQSVHEYIYIQA